MSLLSPLSTRVERSFPLQLPPIASNSFQAADPAATPSPWIYITSQQAPAGLRRSNLWGSKHKISHNSIEKAENYCPKCKLLFFLLEEKKKSHFGLQRHPLKRWFQWLLSKLHTLRLGASALSKDPSICITPLFHGSEESTARWRGFRLYSVARGRPSWLLLREPRSTSFAVDPVRTQCEDKEICLCNDRG